MKMNVETAGWEGQSIDSVIGEEARIALRRRRIIIALAAAALVVFVALALLLTRGQEAATPPKAGAAPHVTVIVPGRQQVARVISSTGSLVARREMPVGVAGEGGMVARVLVEAGDWVSAGQTLAVIERSVQAEESRQLAASIDVARADAALAQQELERAQALVSRGFVSKADVDRRIAARNAANARVRVAQAQLGQSRARIGRLDIRAPASGLVLERKLEAGQVVGPGSGALFRIAQDGQIELHASLSQKYHARVTVGTTATVTPIGSTETFAGRVWQVAPVIDPQTRQGDARIALSYAKALRPGGFASVEMRVGMVTAPLLPESAVQSDERGNYVYVVDGANKVARRGVTVGDVSDAGVTITQGLQGNERIVLSAAPFLNPGDRVQPVRARAAR